MSCYEANSLAKKISKFKFIYGIVVWHNILSNVNVVSKSLQSQSIDMAHCLKLIENLTKHFKEIREGTLVIDEWFERAKKIQSEFSHDPIRLDNMATQQRPVRIEVQEDLSGEDKEKFKIFFVYPILDVALSKLEERVNHLAELQNTYGFLFDLHNNNISSNQCQQIETSLTSAQDGSKDLDGT